MSTRITHIVTKTVMLGHFELQASLAMGYPRPAGMSLQNMAVCENLVPSNKGTGSKSYLVTVRIRNLDSINS